MRVNCEIIRDLIPLYADNLCSEKSRELVEKHCTECAECRERLEAVNMPLPENKICKKPENHMKKVKRHYIRLAAATVLLCLLAALPVFRIVMLTSNENDSGTGVSWSSIAMEKKLLEIGENLEKGNYEEAFENIEFLGPKREKFECSDEEKMHIREDYEKIFSELFADFPIESVDANCMRYGSFLKGMLMLNIDKSYTDNVPLMINMHFEKYEDGRLYLHYTQPQYSLNTVSAYGEPSVDQAYSRLCSHFTWLEYPAYSFRDRLTEAVLSGHFEQMEQILMSRERCELFDKGTELYGVSAGETADYDEVIGSRRESEEFRKAEKEYRDRYAAYYEKITDGSKDLFYANRRFVSAEADVPRYIGKKEIYPLRSEHMFSQDMTIKMETSSGESFSVSFTVNVYSIYGCIPFENITYSENTPDDFKEEFEKLFG